MDAGAKQAFSEFPIVAHAAVEAREIVELRIEKFESGFGYHSDGATGSVDYRRDCGISLLLMSTFPLKTHPNQDQTSDHKTPASKDRARPESGEDSPQSNTYHHHNERRSRIYPRNSSLDTSTLREPLANPSLSILVSTR